MTEARRRELNAKRVGELLPPVQAKAREFLNAAENAGMPLLVTCGYRSLERQARLYAQGRTKPGKVVTHARPGQSWHNWRCAFDVVFIHQGRADWNGPWEHLGVLGEGIGLTWGGHFRGIKDRPHFEYHPHLTLGDAQHGSPKWEMFARSEGTVYTVSESTTTVNAPDETPSPWAREAWEWCHSEGIITGGRPRATVTRQELAVIIMRALTGTGATT